MSKFAAGLGLQTLLLTSGFLISGGAHAANCEKLGALALKDASIGSATAIAAAGGLPAYCRVYGVARPTADSEINFEVWLPLSGWNGKFNGTGNGAYGGTLTLPEREMAVGLSRGYAAAGTDMGHSAQNNVSADAHWALGHPEKIADWGYRAAHLTAINAKAIIQAFYGNAPTHSYWTGCSDGGREALMEAQRYPDDYDGIVAGAPANFWTAQSAAWVWEAQASRMDAASRIPVAKLPAVTKAARAACDRLDGLADNSIDDPRQCRFDPATIQCKDGDGPDYLTGPQVDAVRKIYAGPRNPRTGQPIYPGLEPGGEFGWAQHVDGPQPFLGGDFFKYFVFNDANWDIRSFDYDRDLALARSKVASTIESNSPDLSGFRARGGKLILYHGWADPSINPRNTIEYFERVRAAAGTQEAARFMRLFMVPGMGHCTRGPGPNAFGQPILPFPEASKDAEHNVFSALEDWIEKGKAPEKIVATKYVDDDPVKGVERTRPLCAYPRAAHWNGNGNISEAANFSCVSEKAAAK